MTGPACSSATHLGGALHRTSRAATKLLRPHVRKAAPRAGLHTPSPPESRCSRTGLLRQHTRPHRQRGQRARWPAHPPQTMTCRQRTRCGPPVAPKQLTRLSTIQQPAPPPKWETNLHRVVVIFYRGPTLPDASSHRPHDAGRGPCSAEHMGNPCLVRPAPAGHMHIARRPPHTVCAPPPQHGLRSCHAPRSRAARLQTICGAAAPAAARARAQRRLGSLTA